MIKILPYYERGDVEGGKLLALYLNIVADVVPFQADDIFNGIPPAVDTKSGTPRKRTSHYKDLIQTFGVPHTLNDRDQDALLARRLVMYYSKELHDYLYKGAKGETDFHVNKENLRALLTVRMPCGVLPENMDFRLPEDCLRPELSPGKRKKLTEAEKTAKANREARKKLLLQEVFRYEQLASHEKIYEYLEALGAGVCPYCNRQFITTVSSGSRRTRPQLDHFKNKSDYPFLALSINNLVPSCGVCNLLKHDKDSEMLYPYEEGIADLYVFATKDRDGYFTDLRTGATRAPETFDVVLRPNGDEADPAMVRAKGSIGNLALKKLYQSHKDYITAIYYQRYIHTDEMLEDILTQCPDLFRHKSPNAATGTAPIPLSEEERPAAKAELKRMLLMMDYRRQSWGNQPLSKLTNDISEEIDRLERRIVVDGDIVEK